MFKIILISTLCFILCLELGCDYGGMEEIKIKNQTDSTLVIDYILRKEGSGITKQLILSPNKEQLLTSTPRGINQVANDDYIDTMLCFDIINVRIIKGADSFFSIINYRSRVNWNFNKLGKWSTEYSTSVELDDF